MLQSKQDKSLLCKFQKESSVPIFSALLQAIKMQKCELLTYRYTIRKIVTTLCFFKEEITCFWITKWNEIVIRFFLGNIRSVNSICVPPKILLHRKSTKQLNFSFLLVVNRSIVPDRCVPWFSQKSPLPISSSIEEEEVIEAATK